MNNENDDIVKHMGWKLGDGKSLGVMSHPESESIDEESELNPESLCAEDFEENELLERIKNSRPFADYYNPDGTLKPFAERPPIFTCETKEGDSEKRKKSKQIIAEFINRTYTKEMDDEISKKFMKRMLFGAAHGIFELIPAPGKGKSIVITDEGYKILKHNEESENCPLCNEKEKVKYEGNSDSLNELFYCEKCEKFFEVDNPEYT